MRSGAPPARIRNREAYAAGQPDLDVFNKCFEGFTSPKFCGTDVDGTWSYSWAPHGLWERRGHFLIQEHKQSRRTWIGCYGQWLALNMLGEFGKHARKRGTPGSLFVVATYGENPDQPTHFHWLPVRKEWRRWRTENDFATIPARRITADDIETWPHRAWIRWASIHR